MTFNPIGWLVLDDDDDDDDYVLGEGVSEWLHGNVSESPRSKFHTCGSGVSSLLPIAGMKCNEMIHRGIGIRMRDQLQ